MKRKTSTKRALLLSALSLLTCVSMLIGTTYAWFTDSVTSGSNVIKSGSLDIVMEYWDGDSWEDAEGKVIPFVAADRRSEILWEPGCTYEMAPFRIRNEGSLSAKLLVMLNGVMGDEKLMEAIELKTRINNIPDSVLNGSAGNQLSRFEDAEVGVLYGMPEGNILFDWSLAGKGDVTPGTGHTDTSPEFTLFGHMAEEAGNEYQGLSIEGVSITVIAAQQVYEFDSFNKYYDKDAKYPATAVDIKTAADFKKVKAGNIANLCADVSLTEAVTLPADVVLCGNGHLIDGSVYAGGDLTISGHVKVTAFSATYYDRTITIGEGSCLEVTGTGRVTLAYNNVFNVIGTLENAKNTDKATVQPSLIIPGGISITGGNDATLNVTNAYVKIGSTTSKNSAADGTFTLNFTNSIAEFTNQLTLSEPTGGKNPTFNINIKDSVLTAGTKFIVAAPNSNVVIDNSDVTLKTYFRNSGNMTLKNGSALTGATIQFGENGGNDGTTTVDHSSFNISATSAGHALDGKGTGKLVLQNGATANVDYYKALVVEKDATSSFSGTEVN